MQAEPSSPALDTSLPRKRATWLGLLSLVYGVELYFGRFLPETSYHHSWAGSFWRPTWVEGLLYVLMNLTLVVLGAGLLTADRVAHLSRRVRCYVMAVVVAAASLVGVLFEFFWESGQSHWAFYEFSWFAVPAWVGWSTLLFHTAAGFGLLRWMVLRLTVLRRSREAARASTTSLALLVALACWAIGFSAGQFVPSAATIVGITSILYAAHQFTLLERPGDLLLAEIPEGDDEPQL